MIKGCQRKIILVQGAESSLFETAYFVLRKSAESKETSHSDIMKEANRIIERGLPSNLSRVRRRERIRKRLKFSAFFFAGAAFGGAAAGLCFLLLA